MALTTLKEEYLKHRNVGDNDSTFTTSDFCENLYVEFSGKLILNDRIYSFTFDRTSGQRGHLSEDEMKESQSLIEISTSGTIQEMWQLMLKINSLYVDNNSVEILSHSNYKDDLSSVGIKDSATFHRQGVTNYFCSVADVQKLAEIDWRIHPLYSFDSDNEENLSKKGLFQPGLIKIVDSNLTLKQFQIKPQDREHYSYALDHHFKGSVKKVVEHLERLESKL